MLFLIKVKKRCEWLAATMDSTPAHISDSSSSNVQGKPATGRPVGSTVIIEHVWTEDEFCASRMSTVCPGSSDPPEKIFNIFASENEVYTIY